MSDTIKLGQKYNVKAINVKVEIPLTDGKFITRTISLSVKELNEFYMKSKMENIDQDKLLDEFIENYVKVPQGKEIEDKTLIMAELMEIIAVKLEEYMADLATPSNKKV